MADVTTLEPWERLFESAWRAVLRPSTQQRLGQRAMELLTPQNLAVFAVVMVAYVGGSAAAGPVGAVLNGIVGAAGLYALGKEILELAPILYKWGMTAWQAQTEAELEDAAGFFADGIVIIGPDLVLLLFGSAAFRMLRKVVLPRLKLRNVSPKLVEPPAPPKSMELGRTPKAAESLPTGGKPALVTKVAGVAADLVGGAGLMQTTKVVSEISPWAIALPVGLLAVGGAVLLLRKRPQKVLVR
jgi:hypothetical protein